MNDTLITLTGWLGADVTTRDANGVTVANLRVAATPRRYDKRTEAWVDGDTQWYAVSAWRGLADNCAASLRRGDPVVVHGRLTAETWTNKAGIEVTSMHIEAQFVGHDLNRGVSRFARNPRSATPDQQGAAADRAGQDAPGPVVEAGRLEGERVGAAA